MLKNDSETHWSFAIFNLGELSTSLCPYMGIFID